jgi:integrase/recombinase XerD
MNKYSINGITVALIRDIRKRVANELCPLRIRVTFMRDAKFYSTGYMLDADDWSALPESKSKRLLTVKESVNKIFDLVKSHVKELGETGEFSFSSLNKRLARATGDTINVALNHRISKLYKEGKISTSDWYKNTLKNLENYQGGNIRFRAITVDWLKGLERHLIAKDRSYTTVSMIMRALRAIINEGKNNGVIKETDYPFGEGKYVIPEPTGRSMALTLPQIGQIIKHQCKNEVMRKCRDMWVFSYLCNGANVTDLSKMKYSNIENGEMYFYRQKTFGKGKMSEIRAILTKKMQEIIDDWGNKKASKDTLIFDVLQGNESPLEERRKIKNFTRHLNEYMEKIGSTLNMGKITTYHARHSYATVLKRSGVNISYISESLGHSNLKTTENYLAKFETEERMKNSSLLTDFDKPTKKLRAGKNVKAST